MWVVEELTEGEEIAVNAGLHTELIWLRYDDSDRLIEPKVFRFAEVPA